MEIGFGVRHTREQLERGHEMVLAFVGTGEIPMVEEGFVSEIVRRWQA
jgi:hypothetical protein